jgi:carbon-monoxide dehydrogenase iron sulfur subunit
MPKNFVEENGPVSFSVNCRHCEDPPCVEACIAGAMVQDFTTGKVIHIADKCVGCWSCIMTCPYGAIKQNLEGTRVIKCDLCPGREIPACVSACPNRALLYQEG